MFTKFNKNQAAKECVKIPKHMPKYTKSKITTTNELNNCNIQKVVKLVTK